MKSARPRRAWSIRVDGHRQHHSPQDGDDSEENDQQGDHGLMNRAGSSERSVHGSPPYWWRKDLLCAVVHMLGAGIASQSFALGATLAFQLHDQLSNSQVASFALPFCASQPWVVATQPHNS